MILLLILCGYPIGYIIGFLAETYHVMYGIDDKKETEDYMNKKYGKDWTDLKWLNKKD